MNERSFHPAEPPRLLTGAALLFWSGMIGHPIVGLLCAFFVEGRAWFKVRWEFSERAYVRAWIASLTLLVLTLIWTWLEGARASSMFSVLSWLPVYFLPLILVQQYSSSWAMLLNTFSHFARRKMQVDRKKGRKVDPVKIHFGYVYLVLVLISAALGETSRVVFFVGLCVFVTLALYFVGVSSRQRPVVWGISIFLALSFGFGGALLMDFAYRYFASGRFMAESSTTFPSEQMTSIGKVGKLKLSHRIYWRVKTNGGYEPSLYREAVFNKYGQGLWRHIARGGVTQAEDWANEMATRGDQGDQDYRFVFDRRDLDIDATGANKLEITGTLEIPGPTPVPLPSTAQMIRGLQADGVDYNSLGTVIVTNPDSAVTRFEVYLGSEVRHEEDPYSEVDLVLPFSNYGYEVEVGEEKGLAEQVDAVAIKKVVDELGIRGVSAPEAMAKLRYYFVTNFDYTLYQPGSDLMGSNSKGAIARFLLDSDRGKKGHCEYFATAATLLLREAGIPARYAIGYAAKERSEQGEWLLRGIHGHAWCRVYEGGKETVGEEDINGEISTQWTGGKWVDFDPTPPDWLAVEGSGLPWEQKVADLWQVARQNLQVWRSKKENQKLMSLMMGAVLILTLSYVSYRLWRSRLKERPGRMSRSRFGRDQKEQSPFLMLERSLERHLGPRPQGLPLTAWAKEAGRESPLIREPLEQVILYHWKSRFDPLGLEEGEFEKFRDLCKRLKRELG